MPELQGYRVWYRNDDGGTKWTQAVVINEPFERFAVLINATGKAVVGTDILIHHNQDEMIKYRFLGRIFVLPPENKLGVEEQSFIGKHEDDLPGMSTVLTIPLRSGMLFGGQGPVRYTTRGGRRIIKPGTYPD